MRNKKKIIVYGILMLLIMFFIYYMSAKDATESTTISNGFADTFIGKVLSVFPSITGEGIFYDIRKYGHISEYALLGVFSTLFFLELKIWLPYVESIALCFLYACSDEFHQLFVPGRSGKFSDVGFDSIGYMIGIIIIYLFVRHKNSIIKSE